MAEKQIYPMIAEKSWWLIRNQFKKTIPSVVNVSYLKSLLSLNSDQSARNIIAPLKQMGIIDGEGKPQQRATDWRSDAKYSEVCATIVTELYPRELIDLFPDTDVDSSAAKSWFMDTCSLGDNAAQKIMSTFALLKSGQIKADSDLAKPTQPIKKAKQPQDKIGTTTATSKIPNNDGVRSPAVEQQSPSQLPTPTLHIDLQIHISPEASSEQIDNIFASMAKHLYGRS